MTLMQLYILIYSPNIIKQKRNIKFFFCPITFCKKWVYFNYFFSIFYYKKLISKLSKFIWSHSINIKYIYFINSLIFTSILHQLVQYIYTIHFLFYSGMLNSDCNSVPSSSPHIGTLQLVPPNLFVQGTCLGSCLQRFSLPLLGSPMPLRQQER